jgi:hypothetical protein
MSAHRGLLVRHFIPRLILLLASALSASATPVLTLFPTAPQGPGGTFGWGFTLVNDSGYIEITNAQFCLNPVNPPACTPSTLGTFTDFISAVNDVIVGPPGALDDPDPASQPFDALAQTGIGSFHINSTALPGQTEVGEILLTYSMFDLDPNNPDATGPGTDFFVAAPTTISVAAIASTPEPSTTGQLAFALIVMALVIPRSRRWKEVLQRD